MTTIMSLLGDIKDDVGGSVNYSRTMARKRKTGNLTAEDHARHERIMEMVRERTAYHELKAREQDEAREQK